MKALMEMGFQQGVLAPQERPDVAALRRLGFSGTDAQVIERAAKEAMPLLVASCSASSMWVANAATVSPSADTADGRVHFTAANLNCKYHRSIEHPTTSRVLGAMFADQKHFAHHAALPAVAQFGDEGAANHTRFCREYGEAGVEFFVFGRSAFDTRYPAPQKYPARQTLEASQAVARLHGLSDDGVVYAQQNPSVIDQGVFHNDVIAVGNGEVLFYHEDAFLDTEQMLAELQGKLAKVGGKFQSVCVPRSAVTVEDAVRSYLFNSQLLSRPDGSMLLIVPEECRGNERVWQLPARSDQLRRADPRSQSLRPQAEHAERRWPGLPATARRAQRNRTGGRQPRGYHDGTVVRLADRMGRKALPRPPDRNRSGGPAVAA